MEVQSIISSFLRTELTNIPVFFREIFSINNYNNALCNAFTWMTVIFVLFYILFHKIIREVLKYWKYPAYLQIRLSQSFYLLLAYLGYFVYVLYANKELNWKELLGYEKDMLITGNMLSNQKLIAYTLISSFQLSQIFCSDSFSSSLKFAALAAVCIWAYILRLLEVPFFLTMLVALTGIPEELCKVGYSLVRKEGSKFSQLLVNFLFICAIMFFLISYGLILHLAILIPAIKKIMDDTDFGLILLCFFIFFWLALLVWKSILLKYYCHRISHNLNKRSETEMKLDVKEYNKIWNFKDCSGNILECSLFPLRTDDGYMLAQLRSEMQRRKEEMIAKRKPKNKNMIIQTLKCMLVIKQKLKEKIKEKRDGKSDEETDEEVEDSDNSQEEECSNLEDEKNSEMQKSGKVYKFNETGEVVGDSEDQGQKVEIPSQSNLEDDDNVELEISNENLDPISTEIVTKSSENEISKVCSNAENCKPINK